METMKREGKKRFWKFEMANWLQLSLVKHQLDRHCAAQFIVVFESRKRDIMGQRVSELNSTFTFRFPTKITIIIHMNMNLSFYLSRLDES